MTCKLRVEYTSNVVKMAVRVYSKQSGEQPRALNLTRRYFRHIRKCWNHDYPRGSLLPQGCRANDLQTVVGQKVAGVQSRRILAIQDGRHWSMDQNSVWKRSNFWSCGSFRGTWMTTDQSNEREQLERSLIDMAVESWRFARLFGRLVSKLDAGEGSRYVNQLRYFQKKLEDSLELKVV